MNQVRDAKGWNQESKDKAKSAMANLKAAEFLEFKLVLEVEYVEMELLKRRGLKKYRELAENEKTSIAFAAALAAETQKITEKIYEFVDLPLYGKNQGPAETKYAEINSALDEAIGHLTVLQDLITEALSAAAA